MSISAPRQDTNRFGFRSGANLLCNGVFIRVRLEQDALRLLLGSGLKGGDNGLESFISRATRGGGSGSRRGRNSRTYLVKNILELVLSQGRALDIFNRSQLLGHAISVFFANGRHLLTGKLFAYGGIVAKIGLRADDEARDTGAVVVDFGKPLFADVLEGGGGGHGEADQKDVGLRV